MQISRLAGGLLTVGLGSLLGCGVTMADLQAINPNAKTLQVPCHPWQVLERVKLFAYRESGNHLASDETPDVLLEFAPHASVFIEVNASAPKENAQVMASEYGLVCQQDLAVRSTPLEALREEKPCSVQASHAGARQQGNLLAAPGEAPCDTPKKTPIRIHVCVKPTWIKADVKEWAIFKSKDKKGSTEDREKFDADTTQADVIFVLDPAAPPETAYYFTKDPQKLSCAKKPAKTFDQMVAADAMPDLVDLNAQMKAMEDQATGKTAITPKTGSGASGTGTAGTNTTTPKKGDEKTTDTSSPTGQGPPLSFFERLSRNMSLAGALAQGDTSGNAKDPNGHRNGIVNGTNVGGWTFPPLQFGVSAVQIISAVGLSPKQFVDKIAAATKQGQRVIINKVDKDALKMVDQLIKETSQYEVAKGLQEVGSVIPYAMGEKITAGLGGKLQSHKIFEKQAFEYFGVRKFGSDNIDDLVAKAPSVVLTDAEHKVITKEFNAFWRKVKNSPKTLTDQEVKKKLIAEYQRVYRDHPHWLESIQHLFNQLP